MVTIFADASHDPKTKECAWGCWIKENGVRGRFYSREFKTKLSSSVLAEFCALVNAVYVWGYGKSEIQRQGPVVLESDCLSALQAVMKCAKAVNCRGGGVKVWERTKDFGKDWAKPMKTLQIMLEGKEVRVKHIKGHTLLQNGRSRVQEECDKLAKKKLRDGREREER